MTAQLAVGMIAVSASLLTFALGRAVFGAQRDLTKRLRSMGDYTAEASDAASDDAVSASGRAVLDKATLIKWSDKAFGRIWSAAYRDRVRTLLASAGDHREIEAFLASKVGYAAGAALGMWAVVVAGDVAGPTAAILIACAGVGGLLLPDSRLKESIKKRQHAILRELPDALDMLTISVTAGLGFDQALRKYVKTGKGEVAAEFTRALKEINAGASRRQAYRAMADRIDVPEVSAFVASVLQADSFGTPIADVLRTQSAEMRLRRRQRAEEEAQKAPVKMTIPLMLIIMPATILLLLGPAIISLAKVFG